MSLDNCITNLEKALISNKEDTEAITNIASDALQKIDTLQADIITLNKQIEDQKELFYIQEKKNRNYQILTNSIIIATSLSIVGYGIYDLYYNEKDGLKYIITGLSYGVTLECVYQFGRLKLRIW